MLARRPRLSALQTFVGLAAGIMSIAGALLTVPKLFAPAPGKGEVVAVVQAAKTQKAVADATVEILTPRDAIVTTLSPNYFGKARYTLGGRSVSRARQPPGLRR